MGARQKCADDQRSGAERASKVMTRNSPGRARHDPAVIGGTVVFAGTFVPLRTLFDALQSGESLDQYLDRYPAVARRQAIAALQLARDVLVCGARSV
jgi:uncharacterized protein (DUF433 family)